MRCSTPGIPLGILEKSPRPELLLLLEAERAVVGRHDRQVVGAQPAPQGGGVVRGPQRRRADELGALEVRPGQVVERQVEVLRAGLGEDVLARVPGLRDRRPVPARRTGARCRAGSPRPRPERWPGGWPRPRAPAAGSGRGGPGRCRPAATACATSTSIAMPFSACIMIVAPLPRRLLHRRAGSRRRRVEHARVGHEHLEAGHPGVDAGLHLLERVVVDVGEDHVEAVVDRAVARRPSRATCRGVASRPVPLAWMAKSMIVVVPP